MPRDAYLEQECARARRLAESLNDSVSRRLLRQYVADLREEQQKRRSVRTLSTRAMPAE